MPRPFRSSFRKAATIPSEAVQAIWSDWDDFVSHATSLQEAALAFTVSAEAGAEAHALRPDFEGMAKSCLACHEDFRQPGGGPAF